MEKNKVKAKNELRLLALEFYSSHSKTKSRDFRSKFIYLFIHS